MTFEQFKNAHGGLSVGQADKLNNDKLMEWDFDNDIGTRMAYFFDYYHDNNKTQLGGLSPDKSMIPIKVKYYSHTTQTYSKDQVTFRIQMKPSQEITVPYYEEVFGNRYGAAFPVGLYCLIEDSHGVFNRWLVVGGADYYDPQFSTFEILPCDYIFRWIDNNTRYEMAGVIRSQNSYNSGVWLDRLMSHHAATYGCKSA